MNTDYYKVLNIARTASTDEIKRAYRKLAKAYHPDANPGKNTEAKMKEINLAYSVLSDPEKRRHYDQFGNTSQARPQYTSQSHNGTGYSADPFQDIFDEILRQQKARQAQYQSQEPYQRSNANPLGRAFFYFIVFNLLLRWLFGF